MSKLTIQDVPVVKSKVNPRSAVVALRAEVRKVVYEMEEVVDLSIVALIACQNLCLLGKPGAAKSKVITEIMRRITDGKLFTVLLTKTSTPEDVFGPLKLDALKAGRYERVIEGRLPTADAGFVDECFKANASILNSLLTAMNERLYDHDGKRIQIPLISLFGASNEMPQEEGLAAMWDRFVIRSVVDYMTAEASFKDLWSKRATGADKATPTATLTLAQLKEAQIESRSVVLSDSMMDRLLELRRELIKAGVEVSPRRWSEVIPVLQASAWLAGRLKINDDDLSILTSCLWTTLDQRVTVRKIINKVANPAKEQALELLDNAAQMKREYDGLGEDDRASKAMTIAPQIKKAGEKVKGLIEGLKHEGREVEDLEGRLAELRTWYQGMIQKLMG